MKRLSFVMLLLLTAVVSFGQFLQVTEGPVFPDPGDGVAKILQMKDGSTMFLHISFKTGVMVQVYEPQYRVRTESKFEPAYGNLTAGNIEGIFEINSDAVVMVSDAGMNETVLYRLIIDGKTGRLKEEKKIAVVSKQPVANATKKTDADFFPVIAVQKDSQSETYAVALFKPYESSTTKRIEIILYGKDNNEMNRSFYSSRTEQFKYLRYLDMIVMGQGKVAMLLYGHNIENTGEKNGELILASLEKNSNSISFTELKSFSNDLFVDAGICKYDSTGNRVYMLTTATVKSASNKPGAFLCEIDLTNRQLLTNNEINPGDKFAEKYAGLFGKKAVYAGIPQYFYLNTDGSFTVIFEEQVFSKEKDTAVFTLLRNTAVVNYNRDAAVVNAYLVPVDHYLTGVSLSSFYQSQREKVGQLFQQDNQFKSTAYISDGHNSFILFNDKEVNANASAAGKPVSFKELSGADAFYCLLDGKDILPVRKYVFGKPADEYSHNLAYFTVFDYDRDNNILVLLKEDKRGNHPGVKLLWLQP